jgi:hypothetical protein
MVGQDNIKCAFHDNGKEVEVSIKVDAVAEPVDVYSTTTALTVKDKNRSLIVNVPQLFSTVDASKTIFEVVNGELSITLQKLAPDEKWTSLEAAEVGCK